LLWSQWIAAPISCGCVDAEETNAYADDDDEVGDHWNEVLHAAEDAHDVVVVVAAVAEVFVVAGDDDDFL